MSEANRTENPNDGFHLDTCKLKYGGTRCTCGYSEPDPQSGEPLSSNPGVESLIAECERYPNTRIWQTLKDTLRTQQAENERLTRYSDECREKFNSEYKATRYLLAQVERLRAALEEAVRYMGAVKPDVYARTHAPLLKPPKVTPSE